LTIFQKQSKAKSKCIEEKKTFFMETSAFLTSVNLVEKGPKKLDDYFPKAAEINQHHSKLNELISVSI